MTKENFDEIDLKVFNDLFLNSLKMEINDSMMYNTFFAQWKIHGFDNKEKKVIIASPQSNEILKMIKNNYDENILKALNEAFNIDCNYSFLVIKNPTTEKKVEIVKDQNKKVLKTNSSSEKKENNINANFTFRNYCISDFNLEAFEMAQMIIDENNERKVSLYSPIFLYAKSGLGKTHLLFAIHNELTNRNKNVKYINPNIFTSEVSLLLQENDQKKINKLKNELNSYDVLIFDDFQNFGIGSKRATIQLIYDILDYRINNELLTIFAADKHINYLPVIFGERLISRLSYGLQIEIKPPNQSDLLKVLDFLLESNNFDLSNWEKDAKKYITRNNSQSIRNLIGAITRIKFFTKEIDKRMNSKYTLAVVTGILETIHKNRENITPDTIIEYVSKYYKISKKEMIGKSRTRDVVLARYIAIYIIKEQLKLPYEKIGQFFGGRDHSTILTAVKKVKDDFEKSDKNLKNVISTISDDIYKSL
ncbi:chromosomal replication initiator protein DnaA [Mycoplasmopsis gallinarum]